jgi:N6-adenosine-specific RNA methylase IME4
MTLLLAAGPTPLLLPAPRYGVILADPPWKFYAWGQPNRKLMKSRIAEAYYPTMPTEDIAKLNVGSMAADDCALFMWACWPTLPDALELGRAWGFEYKTCAFTWAKMNPTMENKFSIPEDDANWFFGMGYWTRANTEVCLLFTRGNPKRLENNVRQLIVSPIREHSRKPDQQYDYIERLVSGPYLELFARRKRAGWYSWGNEIESDVQIEVAA